MDYRDAVSQHAGLVELLSDLGQKDGIWISRNDVEAGLGREGSTKRAVHKTENKKVAILVCGRPEGESAQLLDLAGLAGWRRHGGSGQVEARIELEHFAQVILAGFYQGDAVAVGGGGLQSIQNQAEATVLRLEFALLLEDLGVFLTIIENGLPVGGLPRDGGRIGSGEGDAGLHREACRRLLLIRRGVLFGHGGVDGEQGKREHEGRDADQDCRDSRHGYF